jgi:hypothetical protein
MRPRNFLWFSTIAIAENSIRLAFQAFQGRTDPEPQRIRLSL